MRLQRFSANSTAAVRTGRLLISAINYDPVLVNSSGFPLSLSEPEPPPGVFVLN